ncbi:hypothetical protein BH18ACT15_BH18ACT15_03010 [soil metagenome]
MAWQIAAKDLRRSLRDRSAIMISIVAPLSLAFILSVVLGGSGESSFSVRYAVVNQDGGPIGKSLVDKVLGGMVQAGFAKIVAADTAADAKRRAQSDDVAAAFVIPSGFSQAVRQGQASRIEVIASPDAPIGAQIARSAAEGFASDLKAVQLSIATTLVRGGPPDPAALRRLRQAASRTIAPARVTTETAGSREFDDKTFFAAGMSVFFLFFTTQFGAVSLLAERHDGTLARLLAAPIARSSVIAGKALFTFALGIVSLTVLVVASTLLMGAQWGDPVGVAIMVLAGVFAAMGVQSVVTTLAKSEEQAGGYGSIVAVTLGLLGGTFFPLSQGPGFLETLSFLTPHAWLMRGFGDLSGGAGTLSDILPSVGALLLFGMVTGAVAFARSRSLVVGP